MENSNTIIVSPVGTLSFANKIYRCALGKSGVRTDKGEGDGATPAGTFPIREVLYRPDRVAKPKTGLKISALKRNDAWSDDPKNIDYNKRVLLPHSGRVERLWRKDQLYNIIVVIGYNDENDRNSRGSAIFLHVVKTPLLICVRLSLYTKALPFSLGSFVFFKLSSLKLRLKSFPRI